MNTTRNTTTPTKFTHPHSPFRKASLKRCIVTLKNDGSYSPSTSASSSARSSPEQDDIYIIHDAQARVDCGEGSFRINPYAGSLIRSETWEPATGMLVGPLLDADFEPSVHPGPLPLPFRAVEPTVPLPSHTEMVAMVDLVKQNIADTVDADFPHATFAAVRLQSAVQSAAPDLYDKTVGEKYHKKFHLFLDAEVNLTVFTYTELQLKSLQGNTNTIGNYNFPRLLNSGELRVSLAPRHAAEMADRSRCLAYRAFLRAAIRHVGDHQNLAHIERFLQADPFYRGLSNVQVRKIVKLLSTPRRRLPPSHCSSRTTTSSSLPGLSATSLESLPPVVEEQHRATSPPRKG